MKIGNMPVDPMTSSHTVRIRQRNALGPSSDGQQYAVVHVTGYIKNWPPSGMSEFKIFSLLILGPGYSTSTFILEPLLLLQTILRWPKLDTQE